MNERARALVMLMGLTAACLALPARASDTTSERSRNDSVSLSRRPDDSVPGPAALFGAPPAGTTAATTHYENNVAAPIPDPGFVTSTILIAGAPPEIWDVDVKTFILHTWSTDLVMSLKSPAGTEVLLSSGNGYDPFAEEGGTNVFNGSVWDDHANQFTNLATEYLYLDGTPATPLVPEGALSKFRGENPNGVWTLRVADTFFTDAGSLQGWSIDVTTLDNTLTDTSVTNTSVTPVAITNNNLVHSVIPIANAGPTICDVDVQTFISHTSTGSLRIRLRSPAGTLVTLSTNNGSTRDNVYNGTLWDDSAAVPASDAPYTNNVVAPALVPEGALGALIGENPNGDWQLDVQQNFASADSGMLNSWSLTITSCTAAECHLVLGRGAGDADFTLYGLTWATQMAVINGSHPVLMDDIPVFPLPTRRQSANSLWKADRPMALSAQVVMFNPDVFPTNPTQWSQRMDVYAAPNEQPTVTWHGTLNGIHLDYATFVGPDGRWYIHYPFTIDGM